MDLKRITWQAVKWRRAQRTVTKLQQKIFQAAKENNLLKLHKYQEKLLESDSAKLLAVRKVTQDNRGKRTAGIDGVSLLKPEERLKMAKVTKIDGKASPIRRVYIPKPGTDEKRPLGIPTVRDRAKQALAKLALEPEWEAKFEPNSYGFRPGRSTRDAIEAIHHSLRGIKTGKYVLGADISKCFDKIDHDKLIEKMNTHKLLERQVKSWLRAGVMDNGAYTPSTSGTPQGGVISPLLSNIALHGMETHLKKWVKTQTILNSKGVKLSPTSKMASLGIIRYADDFVIMHKDLEIVSRAKTEIEKWLITMGLELKESKTSITHTDSVHLGKVGFDFLGFNIRRYSVGVNSRNKFGSSFKTIIKPSKEGIKSHYSDLVRVIGNTNKVTVLITQLNPIIRGWCNYFSTVSSKETYSKLRNLLFYRLWRWARRNHPTRSAEWIYNKYFQRQHGGQLSFGRKTDQGWVGVKYHNQYSIARHVKIKGSKSPYDGDHPYWILRLTRYSGLTGKVGILLKRQKGKCSICSLPFWQTDVMEMDHKIPKSKGGKDGIQNLRLVHGHCHDQRNVIEKPVMSSSLES
uniref:Reverse transcriptase domain-containing protein n=1 Tax=Ulva fasciata TaxID=111617 RepID=A0A0U2KGK0_9CHLO|nr:hypothetical protein [Ulva fasciata]ALG35722.1 hypothetical protein [Ulva fasciata]